MVRGLVAGGITGGVVCAVGVVALALVFPMLPRTQSVADPVPQVPAMVPPAPVSEVMLLPNGAIVPPSGDESQPALIRYAAAAPQGTGPMVSVVMVDLGVSAGGVDAGALASLGLPITVALDPMRPDAAREGARYRAAGLEVAILAAGLPPDATPQDVAAALANWRATVPQAVAVIEAPLPVFQNDQALAQQVVVGLKSAGEGLLTQPLGDNAAQGLAETADVPHARIWQIADAQGGEPAVIVAALDQAAEQAIRSDRKSVV